MFKTAFKIKNRIYCTFYTNVAKSVYFWSK